MLVKVCGLRSADNIRAVVAAGADWFGFIFYPRSPRYVAGRPGYLPQKGLRVGVFVSQGMDEIMDRAHEFNLHAIQLHGDCTPEFCQRLRSEGLLTIRALPAAGCLDTVARPYAACCDYFLFDTPCTTHGGSGKRFDWALLDTYTLDVPFLLSGGLKPDSLTGLQSLTHRRWAGVDLNSGFETAPAMKDASALQSFISVFKNLHS